MYTMRIYAVHSPVANPRTAFCKLTQATNIIEEATKAV